MNRRGFIARTLAALSAVASWPRSLFAAKPLDFTVTKPKLHMIVCDYGGTTLAKMQVSVQPAIQGAVPFKANGVISCTGTANHCELFSNGKLVATIPITGDPYANGIYLDSRNLITGWSVDFTGTIRDDWGFMQL